MPLSSNPEFFHFPFFKNVQSGKDKKLEKSCPGIIWQVVKPTNDAWNRSFRFTLRSHVSTFFFSYSLQYSHIRYFTHFPPTSRGCQQSGTRVQHWLLACHKPVRETHPVQCLCARKMVKLKNKKKSWPPELGWKYSRSKTIHDCWMSLYECITHCQCSGKKEILLMRNTWKQLKLGRHSKMGTLIRKRQLCTHFDLYSFWSHFSTAIHTRKQVWCIYK